MKGKRTKPKEKEEEEEEEEEEKNHQVEAVGRRSISALSLAMVNLVNPSAPSNAANPPMGTLELPVTN